MPRGRKKKNAQGIKLDLVVVAMFILSIILSLLIYKKSGFIGEHLSPMLGGVLGVIKYVIPFITFAITIYLIRNKEDISSKILQYGIFLIAIASIFAIKNVNINQEFWDVVNQQYELGILGTGGGAIGAIFAIPFVKLLGTTGALVLSIGIAVITAVYIFEIKVASIIFGIFANMNEKRIETSEALKEERVQRRLQMEKMREQKGINPNQTSIDLDVGEGKRKSGFLKNLNFDENEIGEEVEDEEDETEEPVKKKSFKFRKTSKEDEEVEEEETEEDELFAEEDEEEDNKAKQVLKLQHTMTVEEENYEFPSFNLLNQNKNTVNKNAKKEIMETAQKLQETLTSFGVSAKVVNVSRGPSVTRYEIQPDNGVRVNKIANLSDDIALNLAASSLRIEAPIPGKQAVGIEVPNKNNDMVFLRDIIQSNEFQDSDSRLAFALGKDVAGDSIVTDIKKMPHVLIAGATGSGKSVCINTLITSIIYKSKPSEVKLVMIDPKVVELSVYNGIPHLLIPVVTDPRKAAGALAWAVQEMVNRYNLFAEKGVRDMKGYNEAIEQEGEEGKLPHIVIIIDELADLMMVAKNDVEDAICRLAQMARAAGMHLVIATQRPSVDVITGIIKANIPSRISFAVSSGVDSRTVLDMYGAEELLGKGDMLFFPSGIPKPIRIQGAFVSDKEVEKIVKFLKENNTATYNEDVLEKIDKENSTDQELDENDEDLDPFLDDAIKTVVETRQASTSFIQRRFKVGYARAGRIIDQMEARGIISGYEGSKPRQVLVTKEEFQESNMNE